MENKCRIQGIILTVIAIHTFFIFPLVSTGIVIASEGNSEADSAFDISAPTVIHNTPKDGVMGKPIKIEAIVTDNNMVENVILYYRIKGDSAYSTKELLNQHGDLYTGDIKLWYKTAECIEYWIKAEDQAKNIVMVGFDVSPKEICFKNPAPLITLENQEFDNIWVDPLHISATVTDDQIVEKVTLFYRSEGDIQYAKEEMANITGNIYQGVIPSNATTSHSIEFVITAKDNMGNNTTVGSFDTPKTALFTKKDKNNGFIVKPIFNTNETEVMQPKISKPWYKKWWVWTIVIAAAGGGGAAMRHSDPEQARANSGIITIN